MDIFSPQNFYDFQKKGLFQHPLLIATVIIKGTMTKADFPLPNWKVDVKEVSAGVYSLVAIHTSGPTIEMTGTDESKLIKDAMAAARTMENEITTKKAVRRIT